MNSVDVGWVVAESGLLVSIWTVLHFIIRYISDKPLGGKTVHDTVLKDTLRFLRLSGTVCCTVAILSRHQATHFSTGMRFVN
jgi:hypothetical protein